MPFQKGPVFKNCCIFPRQISRKSANGRILFAKCVYGSVFWAALKQFFDTLTLCQKAPEKPLKRVLGRRGPKSGPNWLPEATFSESLGGGQKTVF